MYVKKWTGKRLTNFLFMFLKFFLHKKEGAFLIRKRTTGDILNQPYALSYYFESKIHHTRINHETNGQFTLEESKDQKPKIQVKLKRNEI